MALFLTRNVTWQCAHIDASKKKKEYLSFDPNGDSQFVNIVMWCPWRIKKKKNLKLWSFGKFSSYSFYLIILWETRNIIFTTTHPWYNGYSTSINACGVWGGQESGFRSPKRSFHTHIHLDYAKIEFLSCIKNIYNIIFFFHL